MFNLLKRAINQKIVSHKEIAVQAEQVTDTTESSMNSYLPFNSGEQALESTTDIYLEPFQLRNRMKKSQEWLNSLEEITRAEIGDFRFSVEALASEMALSRSQLFRRVKDLLGISPNQFIRDIRLQVAKELLENGSQQSVKATAFEVGLKDVVHFSRLFKGKFGFLPSDYI